MTATWTYFDTFEKREEAFRRHVFGLVPSQMSCAGSFWKDIEVKRIVELISSIDSPIGYITPNPTDCLAFSTPFQNIRAAELISGSTSGRPPRPQVEILDLFELNDILYQSLRTLSGGETVKLALAKVFILANSCKELVICSPFSWLSKQNMRFFDLLKTKYEKEGKRIKVLAMAGEDSVDPFPDERGRIKQLGFQVILNGVKTTLRNSIDQNGLEDRHASFVDFTCRLKSPCLLAGDNGQGKSLLSFILSRAYHYKGQAFVIRSGRSGFARLVFQDIFIQTLHRSFKKIVSRCISRDGVDPCAIYNEIMSLIICSYREQGLDEPYLGCDENAGPLSLLQIKALLAAVRISIKPAALILDEPDWGLSRANVYALVKSIVRVAHDNEVPLIIISHKPWWKNVTNSVICVTKEYTDSNNMRFSLSDQEDHVEQPI